MQETWTLEIPKSEKSHSDQIKQILNDNSKELGIFLSYYFKKEGALVEKVDLSSDFNFKDQSSGDFTLEFDLVHFNACLAIHEQKRDQIKVTFEVVDNKLELKGPYWPEREMDEI